MLSVFSFSLVALVDLILGGLTILLLLRSKSLSAYWPMLVVALWQLVPVTALLLLRTYRIFTAQEAYAIYFYVYWGAFACAAFCSGMLTYTIFKETLRPLKGLQSLGRVMFRWILAITAAIVFSLVVEPTGSYDQTIVRVVSEMQRLSGIVVLGLVAFVVATVRPFGLSFRSRIFGVSLGLSVAVCANISTTGYLFLNSNMFSQSSLTLTLSDCVAQMIWIWYFAVPEPTRKFLLLPTTSPFHQWNLVSERMGYDPGYVAIGGVPPGSFSDAERAIFERIADQDNGRAERLNELSASPESLAGSAPQTLEATEHFNRIWNFRYQPGGGRQERDTV